MTDLDEFKQSTNPFAVLTELTIEQNEKLDILIKLNCSQCDTLEGNLLVNSDILEEKKSNHSVWLKVSKHRRYINIAAVVVTFAILWLDVLKLNPDSEIVGSAVSIGKAIAGFFL